MQLINLFVFLFRNIYCRFDLPVDGGTIVQLEFLRYPTDRFSAIHNLYVPVNQIVNMGDFYMYDAKQLSHNDLPTTITTKTTTNNIISGDFGGTLGPSPIHGDLWIVNSFMPKFSDKDIVVENLCISGNIHDIVTLGGPYIQSNSLMDISTICLDEQNVICVRNGALMYNIPIKVC